LSAKGLPDLLSLLEQCGFHNPDRLAVTLHEHALDPERLRSLPHVILHPGCDTPVFSAALNSDRIRHRSGVAIVLDLPTVMST
jgi:hypothetical protein